MINQMQRNEVLERIKIDHVLLVRCKLNIPYNKSSRVLSKGSIFSYLPGN